MKGCGIFIINFQNDTEKISEVYLLGLKGKEELTNNKPKKKYIPKFKK